MNFFNRRDSAMTMESPKPKTAGAIAFLDEHETMREDLIYYQDECTKLSNGIKLATETIRQLKEELSHVRNERDFLCRHDASIMKSMEIIYAIIKREMAKAVVVASEPADRPDEQSASAGREAALASHQLEEPQA